MARARKFVVRIVLFEHQAGKRGEVMSLMECFRYAGLISAPKDRLDDSGERIAVYFDMYPPKHVASERVEVWAKQNAERMKTFGFNAEAAPAQWQS